PQLSRAERPAQNRAHMILELRTDAAFNGIMARVVHTRRQFVDEHPAIFGEKHLHTKRADPTNRLHGPARNVSGAIGRLRRDGSRRFDDVTNMMVLNGFDERVGDRIPVLGPHDHHRQFRGKGTKFFDVKRIGIAAELLPRGIDIRRGMERGIALPIVPVPSLLENEGPAKLPRGSRDRRLIGSFHKTRQRQTGFGQGAFLQQLVLNDTHRISGWPKWMAESRQSFETVGIDKLIFQRGNINQRAKPEQRLRIVPIGNDLLPCQIGGGTMLFSFEDHDVAPKLQGGLGDHLGELAAADDAQGAGRLRPARRQNVQNRLWLGDGLHCPIFKISYPFTKSRAAKGYGLAANVQIRFAWTELRRLVENWKGGTERT